MEGTSLFRYRLNTHSVKRELSQLYNLCIMKVVSGSHMDLKTSEGGFWKSSIYPSSCLVFYSGNSRDENEKRLEK